MVISDPYATSYGKLINKEKLIKELIKYTTSSTNKNLNYEYIANNGTKLVFIVGCNEDEKELPVWEHPLLYKDIRNDVTIAVDLRKYVKSTKDYPMSISEIIKDKSNCEFLINTALTISDFSTNEFGEYKKVFNNVTTSFAFLMSYLVDTVVKLSPMEKLNVELVSMLYANIMLSPSEDIESYIHAIKARMLNSKLSLPITKRVLDNIVDNCNCEVKDIQGLINNIKNVLLNEKADLINETVLINVMNNLWFGPGSIEIVIIALENMAAWLSLTYTCLNDMTYKRSKLSVILEKYSKQINAKELIKELELVYKSKKV